MKKPSEIIKEKSKEIGKKITQPKTNLQALFHQIISDIEAVLEYLDEQTEPRRYCLEQGCDRNADCDHQKFLPV